MKFSVGTARSNAVEVEAESPGLAVIAYAKSHPGTLPIFVVYGRTTNMFNRGDLDAQAEYEASNPGWFEKYRDGPFGWLT